MQLLELKFTSNDFYEFDRLMSSNLFVVLNSNSNLLTLCRCAYFVGISIFLSFPVQQFQNMADLHRPA